MNFFIEQVGAIMGYMMLLCYRILKNYGLAIILLTLLTKIILLPVSIWVHKNSIRLVKIQPEINFAKANYANSKERMAEEQLEIYKREKYSPLASICPLLIQLVLLMGVIEVIYKPLTYLLHLNSDVITVLIEKTVELTGANPEIGSIQLQVIEAVSNSSFFSAFNSLESSLKGIDIEKIISAINTMNMEFAGFNLALIPSVVQGRYLLVPLIAGLSALILCVFQNKINVLQSESGKINQIGTAALSVGLSLYLGTFVPAGVGLYWLTSNILTILQLLILNNIINPRNYIDYDALENSKKALECIRQNKKSQGKFWSKSPLKEREKADYKRFFSTDDKELVFYAERNGFYKYFATFIEEIIKNSDIIIHYVTSDSNDSVFLMKSNQLQAYYIGDKKLISFMLKIDSDIVVMTSPDLGQCHIKRSIIKKDIEYIYVPHAMGSHNLTLNAGALDYYDTIFSPSTYVTEEIRITEQLNDLPRKNIVECGYLLLDKMVEQYNEIVLNQTNIKTIVIAPSWQKDNIMDSCIEQILDELIKTSYNIIIRAHPQYVRHFIDKIKNLEEKYKGESRIIFEKDFSSNATIYNAALLITDWSNVALEYSFTTKKPSLFINTPVKKQNKEYERIGIIPFDIEARNLIGKSLEVDRLFVINEVVEKLMNECDEYKQLINRICNEKIYNIGNSGRIGANYIVRKLQSISLNKENCDD